MSVDLKSALVEPQTMSVDLKAALVELIREKTAPAAQ